mmetsp:Transcript_5239/g.8881  ORF Transcript_5239/g.8881 Transcript_5239/m.8881 type:complete len:206 (-) Transcript_5239:322-939(-)
MLTFEEVLRLLPVPLVPLFAMSSSFIDRSRTTFFTVSTSRAWFSSCLMCLVIWVFSSLNRRLSWAKSFFRISFDSARAGIVLTSRSRFSLACSSMAIWSFIPANCCCAARRPMRSLLHWSFTRFSSARIGTTEDSTSALPFLASAYISCTLTRFDFKLRLAWSASRRRLVNMEIWLRRFSTSRSFSFMESKALLSTFTAAIIESS